MPRLDAGVVFAVLGPLFLMMSLLRAWRAGRIGPQSRTWLLGGTVFSVVAVWLWTRPQW